MRSPQGPGCSILGNYSPRGGGGLGLGKQTGGGAFQVPCILAHPSICIFVQKHVLGARCVQGAVLDAKNKATDDRINTNHKTSHVSGSCYGAINVLSDVFHTCHLI